jgi:hypothetical protein
VLPAIGRRTRAPLAPARRCSGTARRHARAEAAPLVFIAASVSSGYGSCQFTCESYVQP